MKEFDFTIKVGSGKYNILDKAYNQFIINTLLTLDDDKKDRWSIYNLIINEFLKSGDVDSFEEIKYRVTDGEDPNKIILDMIQRDKTPSSQLWYMKKKIEEYIEEDFYSRFIY
jgi:hypothetical protein